MSKQFTCPYPLKNPKSPRTKGLFFPQNNDNNFLFLELLTYDLSNKTFFGLNGGETKNILSKFEEK